MFVGELRTVTNLRQFPDVRETLFMLEWEALVGDALPVTEKGDGGVNFHGRVLSKARNIKYSWAIEKE